MYIKFLKRGLDFAIALLVLIIASPVFVVLYILIYTKLGRPVFFRQNRPGYRGQVFKMIKFRSMTNETDENGGLLPNEMRLPRFGQMLRSTSLDELPELLNVLVGDMSIVGPRPLRTHYLKYYSVKQNRRHDVLPGITGWAQVNGRNNLNWDEKFSLDLWYVDNISIIVDIKIIWRTFSKVLFRDGINDSEGEFVVPFDEYVKNKKVN